MNENWSLKLAVIAVIFSLTPQISLAAEGLGLAVRPAEPALKLHVIKPMVEEIAYETVNVNETLRLTLGPYEWKKITKRDGRRRWLISMYASSPINMYFVYPGHELGNPPDFGRLNSESRKKWLNVTEIPEDKFLPWHNEYGVGRTWTFYLFNKDATPSRVALNVDTSGAATEEEKKYHPLVFLILISATAAVSVIMYKLIRWRTRNPLTT
jgi:hypothetical protein